MHTTFAKSGRAAACAVALLGALLAAGPRADAQTNPPLDFNRARQLWQRSRNGEALTPAERAYVDRARQERQKGRPDSRPTTSGGTTNVPGLLPLDEMAAAQLYKGQDGGLYGGGNDPPPAHDAAARKVLARVMPLDAEGRPAKDGRIVLISIGMSNTTQEFSRFKELADADPGKSRQVVIVDGAQGGKDAADWNHGLDDLPWMTLERRLQAAGVTDAQVQVVWLKQALKGPARLGEFPRHADELQAHEAGVLRLARQRFPNLQIAYLSSRIYAGYASTPLNPEPYAYESAFAVRGLIQDQIKGEPGLNCDPARGEVKAPLLLWGPYLWANGLAPRKSDGLIWKREDLAGDGTHPSGVSGRDKVSHLLLGFFRTSPYAKDWFLAPAAAD